jgi:hypothetical protein
MRLCPDCTGLESIPLKLMIVAVVASLSVIPASHALQGLENRDFVRRAGLGLNMIISTAQTLTTEGPGSVRTLSLDFNGGGSLRPDSLTIGDRIGGPNGSSAFLRLGNNAMIMRSATNPPVMMTGLGQTALVTNSFVLGLKMSAMLTNRTVYVLVEVA